MIKKLEQRGEMRDKILDAAIETYADLGFIGASTREIAKRAGTSQGLLTYHFKSKNELWFAAVDQLFENVASELGDDPFEAMGAGDAKEALQQIKKFLRFNAKNPHLLKFIIEGGKELNERSEYLIENHARPFFNKFRKNLPVPLQGDMAAHVLYTWMGASTTIYSVSAEFKHLTGVDPSSEEAIDRQAQLIAHLFIPSSPLSMVIKAVKGGLASFKES